MRVVNPIGRKVDDSVQVNACRCSVKGTYATASMTPGCVCREPESSGGQIAHIVYQGH